MLPSYCPVLLFILLSLFLHLLFKLYIFIAFFLLQFWGGFLWFCPLHHFYCFLPVITHFDLLCFYILCSTFLYLTNLRLDFFMFGLTVGKLCFERCSINKAKIAMNLLFHKRCFSQLKITQNCMIFLRESGDITVTS